MMRSSFLLAFSLALALVSTVSAASPLRTERDFSAWIAPRLDDIALRRNLADCEVGSFKSGSCCVDLCDLECFTGAWCSITSTECTCNYKLVVFVAIKVVDAIVSGLLATFWFVPKLRAMEAHLPVNERTVDQSAKLMLIILSFACGAVGFVIMAVVLYIRVQAAIDARGVNLMQNPAAVAAMTQAASGGGARGVKLMHNLAAVAAMTQPQQPQTAQIVQAQGPGIK